MLSAPLDTASAACPPRLTFPASTGPSNMAPIRGLLTGRVPAGADVLAWLVVALVLPPPPQAASPRVSSAARTSPTAAWRCVVGRRIAASVRSPPVPSDSSLSKLSTTIPDWVLRLGGRLNVPLYRATRGRVGGRIGRAPVLLLTSTGRKSGQPRTAPVLYMRAGDAFVVIGSNAGNVKTRSEERRVGKECG